MIEISGAIGALSAGFQTLKVALAARDDAKIEAAISDLKDRLFDLQTANLELVQRLHAAQAQIHTLIGERDQLKARQSERDLYELHNLSEGTAHHAWAYRYKSAQGLPDAEQATIHYLCQPCFDDERKAVLRTVEQWGTVVYVCPQCKAEL